ncbi:CAP domain-containing protein [Algoriphagus limi]|uniref:CAP domain-containing protein n=1 Tax=Algoriphagus limi TaxID=2975273 RepID=A0ABT2G654_9BACT|nr:CAP domain-containing protein [Algoriphagus limi]MCS5489412.1 CAP domain-containing protein [Algoriphagus limi]
MKKLFVLVIFLFQSTISHAQSWTAEDYEKMDWRGFLRLEAIYQELDPKEIDYPLLHAAIFYITNEQREIHGLPQLAYSLKIELLAADHARDMARYNFFSHQSKIRNKRKLRDRFQIQGLNPNLIAENISSTAGLDYEYGRQVSPPQTPGEFTYANKKEAIPSHTYISYAKEVVRLWMESPGHRANILNPSFKRLGCGSQVYGEKNFFNMPYFMNVQCFSD